MTDTAAPALIELPPGARPVVVLEAGVGKLGYYRDGEIERHVRGRDVQTRLDGHLVGGLRHLTVWKVPGHGDQLIAVDAVLGRPARNLPGPGRTDLDVILEAAGRQTPIGAFHIDVAIVAPDGEERTIVAEGDVWIVAPLTPGRPIRLTNYT